jgi:hypothetical protein
MAARGSLRGIDGKWIKTLRGGHGVAHGGDVGRRGIFARERGFLILFINYST